MSEPIDYTHPAHDRRRLHRLRDLVRGSAQSAELLEQLLAALEQLPTAPANGISSMAPAVTSFHERVGLALDRCQKALGAETALLWRWSPSKDRLSLVEADGVAPEKLAPVRQLIPRAGHPIEVASRRRLPQEVRTPAFLRNAHASDVTLPAYGVYIPVVAFDQCVGILLMGGNSPLIAVNHAALGEIGRGFGALLSVHPV